MEKHPELLRAFLECTNEGIIICDSMGTLTYANKKAQDMFGGPTGALNIQEWQAHYKIFRPDQFTPLNKEEAPLYRAFKGETFRNVEIFISRIHENTSFLCICNGKPLEDQYGNRTGAIILFQDITKSRLSEKLVELNQALTQSETRFRAIFEQSPLSIQLLSRTGQTLLVNPAYKKLWGIPEETIKNYILREYNILEDPILDEKGVLPQIRKGFEGETVHIEELLYDPKKLGIVGHPRWASGTIYPLKNSSGEVQEVVLIHQDMTEVQESQAEREKLLSQLSQERSQLEAVIKQMPAGILVADKKSKEIIVSNQQIKNMLGDVETAQEVFCEHLSRTLRGEVLSREQTSFKHTDGRDSIFMAFTSPIQDSSGNITSGVLLAVDATERTRFENIQNFMADVKSILISTIDCDQILLQLADASIPFLADGFIVDLIDGETIRRIISRHNDPQTESFMKKLQEEFTPHMNSPQPTPRVIRSGQPELLQIVDLIEIQKHTLNSKHADLISQIGICSHIAIPLKIRGKVIGALNLLITTNRKKYDEKDLEVVMELGRHVAVAIDNSNLFKEAQEAVKIRDEFISIASHELRTPITSLNLQIEVLNDIVKNLAEETQETQLMKKFMNGTNRQLSRLTRLVEDMLDISRISNGKLSLNIKEVNITSLIREALENFNDQLKTLRIDLKFIDREDILVFCDPERIEQVVVNFMTNAIRYGEKRPIVVSVDQIDQNVVLKFKDHGRGILKSDLKRIFNRFERAQALDDVSGLGLGLFINHQIIEEHRGSISVESSLGTGSTFIVTLPKKTDVEFFPD